MFKRLLILVAVGLALYLPALPNHFVWDDEEQVVANTAVHSVANIPQLFVGSTFNSGGASNLGGLYYKPLMSVGFAVIYGVFGPSPWAFHLLQIGLHIGSGLLLYLILRKIWKNDFLALLTSMLFLIHPQNVETVGYISSLQDTLYMFLGMLGLKWIVISEEKIEWSDMMFAGGCVFLALLSKETGGLFGILIGLYILLFHKRRDLVKWLEVLCIVYGFYLYLRIGVAQVGLDKNMFTPMATLPLTVRLGNIPALVWHYLSQFVWSSRLSISQHWVNSNPGFLQGTVLCGLIVSWLMILWLAIKNKGRIFGFFWVWFGVAMVFHLQIFPLDMTVADRWFYLPMVGFIGSMGSMVERSWIVDRRWLRVVMVIIMIALFVRSSIRIQNWRDGMTLYSHDIQIMSESFDLQNNYGVELYRARRYDEARVYFEKSTVTAPTWWTNWNNLGVIIEQEGDLDTALTDYRRAIDNGQYYLAYENYARILLKQNKWQEARLFLENSLRLFPNNQNLLDLYRYERINER